MERLRELLRGHDTVGIVGNAKNAGKTTVLNALIDAHRGEALGLTSVGLDGEELDAVTYLPKPRIRLEPGTLFATAEGTLSHAEAQVSIRSRTGIPTALGEVVVAATLTAGNVLVGGPATAAATALIVAALRREGATRVFLDGAFARMSHAAAGEAMVYVAGANLSASMAKVVDATRYALLKFALPQAPAALAFLHDVEGAGWVAADGTFTDLGIPSAIGSADALLDRIPTAARWLYLPRALGPTLARRIVERRAEHAFGIVLANPFALVVPDDALRHLFLIGRPLAVLRPTKVLFVAVNPYAPAGHRFDGPSFRAAVAAVTTLPVIDVEEESRHAHL